MQAALDLDIKVGSSAAVALGAVAVVLAAGYAALVRFPSTPYKKMVVHPGLKSLEGGPESAVMDRIKDLYPEDCFPDPKYAQLPWGKIKYHRFGYEFGPKLVLICGISIPSIIWSKVVPLLKANFHILIFDHYGRGYSDGPETTYDANFFATEVALLMQYVKWDKAKIAGVSLGGGIAVAFANAYPHLVDEKIALIAPTGLMSASDFGLTNRILLSPPVQAVISSKFVRSLLAKRYNAESFPDKATELQRLQQILLPGHLGALASSAREGPTRGLEQDYAALGKSNIKVGLFWGTDDEVVPYRLATEALKRIPEAKFVTVPGGGHEILDTHPEIMGKALYDYLR